MAAVPTFTAEVKRLAGIESNLEPAFERDLKALVDSYARLRSLDQ